MTINNQQSKRIDWLDYAKGIGIFLVVTGHTLRAMVKSEILEASPMVDGIDRWIYAFHMPLFFFISGLLIERSLSKSLPKFAIDKLKTIAYPYIFWSLLQGMLQIFASKYTNNEISWDRLWRIVYAPVMQFWFLYVLFLSMLLYAIARQLKISPGGFLVCCIILYLLKIFSINMGTWGVLYQVRTFAIYLGIGAVMGSKFDLKQLRQIPTLMLLAIMGTGFMFVGFAVRLNWTGLPVAKLLLALWGIVATLALAILMERLRIFPAVKQWGTLSMAIFLAHTIASAVLRTVLLQLGIEVPIIHLAIQNWAGIYLPIALYIICRQFKLTYIFRWP